MDARATRAQLDYLQVLGYNGDMDLSVSEASELIDRLKMDRDNGPPTANQISLYHRLSRQLLGPNAELKVPNTKKQMTVCLDCLTKARGKRMKYRG